MKIGMNYNQEVIIKKNPGRKERRRLVKIAFQKKKQGTHDKYFYKGKK